jgi:hypothetical protein
MDIAGGVLSPVSEQDLCTNGAFAVRQGLLLAAVRNSMSANAFGISRRTQ